MNAWFDEVKVRFRIDDDKSGEVSVVDKTSFARVEFDEPVGVLYQDELKDLLRACQMAHKAYRPADEAVEPIEEND